jgi:hypothetical protein
VLELTRNGLQHDGFTPLQCTSLTGVLTAREGWGKVSRVAFSLYFASKNALYQTLQNALEQV